MPPMAGCAAVEASPPPTFPTAGQALRQRQPHAAAEPVNPRTPLRVGIHRRVFPGSTATRKEMPPYYAKNNDSST